MTAGASSSLWFPSGGSWERLSPGLVDLYKTEGEDREMDMLLAVPAGLVSGLEAQSEWSELLEELFYDSLM